MSNESYKYVVRECASATRQHIGALDDILRRLSLVGGQDFITTRTLKEIADGLEITARKLESIEEN